MTTETFFKKFELLADAPNAVGRMRELILHLAMRGKVVEQSQVDVTATELLKCIIEYKSRNPLSGRRGRSKETLRKPINNVQTLPLSWVDTTIGEVLHVIRGASPRPKGDPKYFSSSRTPYHWVKISDIRKYGKNDLLMDTDEFLTEAGMKKSVILPKGTLILTNSATIGIPIVLGIDGCCIHDGFLAFPHFPHKYIHQKFFYYSLHALKKYAEINARGLAQLNLNTDLVRSFPFGLPPFEEQKRIVAKVDDLMALCDKLEEQQKERETKHAALDRASLSRFADAPTQGNLQFLFHKSYTITPADIRKSILTLAVQGKLVPQESSEIPASESVNLAAKEAKKAIHDGIIRRYGLAEPADNSGLTEIPDGWRWSRLVEITNPVPYSIKRGPFGSSIRKDMFVHKGFKVYEQQHAISGDFTKGRYYINKEKFKELRAFELHPKEILISCSGTVGKVAIVPPNIEQGIINQALLKISLHQSALINEYFLILFPAFFMETDELTELQGTAQKNIPGVDVLKVMPFPLPPLAEQKRIVKKVDELMVLVDKLETQIETSLKTGANLLNAIVDELAQN